MFYSVESTASMVLLSNSTQLVAISLVVLVDLNKLAS